MTRTTAATIITAALAAPASAQDCSLLDLNGCGCVNFFQYTIMLQLVIDGGPSAADYDNDGDTDGVDLAFFAANFNPCATTGQLATGLPETISPIVLDVQPVTQPDGSTGYDILVPLPAGDAELISVTNAHISDMGGACFIDTSAPSSGNAALPIPQNIFQALNVPYDSYIAIGDRSNEPSPVAPLAIDLDIDAYTNDRVIDAPIGWVGDATRVGTPTSPGLGSADGNTDNKVVIASLVSNGAQGTFTIAYTVNGSLLIAEATAIIGAEACLADTNNDGMLSPADFTAWIAAFNAAASECDQNADGLCSPADFTAWIANYNTGCP